MQAAFRVISNIVWANALLLLLPIFHGRYFGPLFHVSVFCFCFGNFQVFIIIYEFR
jgi:hypothetical protein